MAKKNREQSRPLHAPRRIIPITPIQWPKNLEVKATLEDPLGVVDCGMQKITEEPRRSSFWSKIDVLSMTLDDFGLSTISYASQLSWTRPWALQTWFLMIFGKSFNKNENLDEISWFFDVFWELESYPGRKNIPLLILHLSDPEIHKRAKRKSFLDKCGSKS